MKAFVGLIFIGLLLLFWWIVQLLYNFTVPRIVESVSSSYDKNKFRKINYGTAITLTLLCTILFGSTIVVQKYM